MKGTQQDNASTQWTCHEKSLQRERLHGHKSVCVNDDNSQKMWAISAPVTPSFLKAENPGKTGSHMMYERGADSHWRLLALQMQEQ